MIPGGLGRKVLASRKVLLLVPILLLFGLWLTFYVSVIGHHSAASGGTRADGARYETPLLDIYGWWFYPAFLGGIIVAVGGLTLIPLHLISRHRLMRSRGHDV
jgi:hypothetical protein